MCGIFGVVGSNQNAAQITFNGLKDIEYRGYDSWGIAYWKMEDAMPAGRQGRWKIEKKTGFLPSTLNLPPSNIAIGHTRWATHGGVTKANAHPHSDCTGKIVLVHNGIVENYLELKKKLKKHKLRSETDTEVVAHLIEDEYRKVKDFAQAVANVFKRLKGLNAIVVTDGKEIIAAKVGPPLVVGEATNELYLSSDPNAILPHTKKLLFLEDNQLVNLNRKVDLFSLGVYSAHARGVRNVRVKHLTPEFTTVAWEHSQSDLAKYKHFLEKEIHEQPQVLKTIANNSKEIEKIANLIRKAYGTFFIACGSASYSCLLGEYLFSIVAKKHVNFSIGSEFNYIQDFLTKKSLLIAISQSGETIDVVEPVGAAKMKGAKIVSMVNVLGSTLYRMADYPLLLNAGMEKAVCSTKALTAMFAHMVLLAYSLIGRREDAEKIILESAREIESIIERKELIKILASKIYKSEHIFILGRGLSYPVALESALKIKENAYTHAEGFAGGELKHGVIALIDKGTPVIVFVPNDETKEAILANAMEVKARGAFVIGVGFENNPVFDYFFEVKDVGASSVIPHPVFAQFLSYYLALKLGNNPDKPRNIAKSVTVK